MHNILTAGGSYERDRVSFEVCNEALRNICGAYHVAAERWRDFRGSIEPCRAAALEFADVRFSECQVVRDRDDKHYRGDHFFLILQAAGTARMRQRGSEASLQPGDCTLIDSRFPSVFEIGPGYHQYSFHLPGNLVAKRFGDRTLPLARTIPCDRGAGLLLSELLGSIVRNAPKIGGADLVGLTIELLATALGLNVDRAMRIQPAQRTMSYRDIAHFIDANIDSFNLSPASIAAHFNTSVRQLYRLLQATGWTPASLIWTRRLARAQELLTQNARNAQIIDIALTCGFKDGAHFSRAYRKAFGHPPKAERNRAGAPPAAAAGSA